MNSVDRVHALRETITSVVSERDRLAARAQVAELKHDRLATSLAQELCPLKRRQRFRVLGLADPKGPKARSYFRAGNLYDFTDRLLNPASIYEVERVNAFGHGLKDVTEYGYSITARRVLRSGRLSSERYVITSLFSIGSATKATANRPTARPAPLHCRPSRRRQGSARVAAGLGWNHERAGLG